MSGIGLKVDHIGYLVKDLDRAAAAFAELGFVPVTDVIRDDMPDSAGAARNVLLRFLENAGTVVELVAPLGEDSHVYERLRTCGEGPYHICYAVEDLAAQMEKMRAQKWMILRRPSPAVAFGGAPVAFLVKKGAGIVELVEKTT